MSIREKFFNAMKRKDSSFIPFEFNLCPSLHEEFKKRFGVEDYVEYFNFPARIGYVEYLGKTDKYYKYFDNLDKTGVSDWGVGHKQGSVAHFTEMQHPMKNFETVEEFREYPYPDPVKDFNWDGFTKWVDDVKARDLIAIAGMEITIFEIAWYLRGMDNFMIDMVINPELANYHLERITEIRCEMAKRYAKSGCDVLRLGDDVSTQCYVFYEVQ